MLGMFSKDFLIVKKLIENNLINSSIKTKIPIEIKVVFCQKEKFWENDSNKIDEIKEKKPAKKPTNKKKGQ